MRVNKPTLPVPLVIKAPRQGSTVGVYIIKRGRKLEAALAEARKFDRQLLVEEFVPGRELTIGILGDQALPILEIIPKGGFYDFTNKYPFLNPQAGGGAEHVCPAKIRSETDAQDSGSGLARVSLDWACKFIRGSMCILPENGEPSVLEVNTIPGMTEASLFPEAAAAAGIRYDELCLRIIELSCAAAGGREMKLKQFHPQTRPRNQRVSNPRQRRQQHLLDVKGASRARPRNIATGECSFSFRKSRWLLRSAPESISARGWAMRRFFFENPDYRLTTIEMQTDGTLQRDQVLKTAGLREGENIFQRQSGAGCTTSCSSCRRWMRCRWCAKCLARSTFESSSASRSPGSRAKNKSPIHFIRRRFS